MIVVICACNDTPRLVARGKPRCGRCGVELGVLLDEDQNHERVLRGLSLAEWFAAPKVPAHDRDCPPPGPCPHLRCTMNLGRPGGFGCARHVAREAPTATDPVPAFGGHVPHHTLDHVGKNAGIGRERVRQIEGDALAKLRPLLKRQP